MPNDETTLNVRRDVLESWMKITGYSRSELATHLSLSRGRISQILNSDQEPSARLIARLLALTHLPFERLFVLKKRARPRKAQSPELETVEELH